MKTTQLIRQHITPLFQAFMNSENFDMAYTQSLHHLKSYLKGKNKDYSWFILTVDQQ